MKFYSIQKIVSGGQTGADRAALDWAIEHGIPHGGWCPQGRKAEDGPLPGRYLLQETPTADYAERTEWNVRDSDATVIFTEFPQLTAGSLLTAQVAAKHWKPWTHLPWGGDSLARFQRFLEFRKPLVLNVAGSRKSLAPNIEKWVLQALDSIL